MDREIVLAVLVALLCGGALMAAGWWPTESPVAASGCNCERRAWRHLWLPLVPAGVLFAALCGWALVEPASAEPVPNHLFVGAIPFAVVLLRATWRAFRSLTHAHPDLAIGTIGVLRPRIICSQRIAATLDAPALAAAMAHERAHARHWDPLRLWLARFGSDLLWPWPTSAARLLYWQHALELARDEEARHSGIAGTDLAAAILGALRLSRAGLSLTAATLGGDASYVEERIARLMQPLAAPAGNKPNVWLLAIVLGVLAALLGTLFGEHAVRTLLVEV